MNKLVVFSVASLLCACAAPQHAFLHDPESYGLYVATTNFDNDGEIVVEDANGGATKLQVLHPGGSQTGYIYQSLPPGHYSFITYTPKLGVTVPIRSANGTFDVQANCYNYGGAYDFETTEEGAVTYSNTTRIKDIEQLPSNLKEMAVGRDVCDATMGKASERMAAADLQGLLTL